MAFLYPAVTRELRVEPAALRRRREDLVRLEALAEMWAMAFYRCNSRTKCFSAILIFESQSDCGE